MALVQMGSFFVKTDVPLLFFTTLFFVYYRQYLSGNVKLAVLMLPVAIAGMLLSKYHGVLIVAFTLLSNPKLLIRPSFWLITLLTCVLFIPHAMWLSAHDFVTVRYHLAGRKDFGFRWKYVINYVLMQPFTFGPAVGFLLLPAALLAMPRDAFERALKFNLIGVLTFFFIASFKVRVHYHWTSIALVPLLLLAIPYLHARPALRSILIKTGVATAIAIIPVRVYLAWDFLPLSIDKHFQVSHGWAQWARDVRKLAGGRNVVFLDDYDAAGAYTFYTGEMAHSYNQWTFQNSQQDLWPIEDAFRGKPAIVINGAPDEGYAITHASNRAEIRYRFTNDFESYSKIDISPKTDGPLHFASAKAVDLPITLVSRYSHPVFFKPDIELSPVLMCLFIKGKDASSTFRYDVLSGTTLFHERTIVLRINPPAVPGPYLLRFVIKPGWLQPSNNGGACMITVDPPQ
jgi:hypothetical protein